MIDTPNSSVAARAVLPFVCFGGLWIVLAHAVMPWYLEGGSHGPAGLLMADGVFLAAAAVLVFFLLRRAVRDVRTKEDESRRIDKRARIAIEASGDGVWEINAPSPAESYSGDVFAMLGIEPIGSSDIFLAFRERIHPDDRSTLQDANAALQTPGQDRFRLKCRVRDNHGHWRHVSIRGRCVERGLDGRPVRIAGVLSDVTEESEREAELTASRDMLNALLGAIPFPTAVVDASGTLKLASDSWRRAAAGQGLDAWFAQPGTLSPRAQVTGASRASEQQDLHNAMQDVLTGRHPEVTLPVKAGPAGASLRPETFLRPYRKGNEIAGAVVALNTVSEDQERIGVLLRLSEELQEQNERLQTLTGGLQGELAELKEQNDRILPENAELRRRADEATKQSEELLRENARLQDSHEDIEIRIEDLQRQIAHLEPGRAEMERRIAELRRGTEELERNNESLQGQADLLQRENRDLQNMIEEADRKFAEIQRAHDLLTIAVDSSRIAILTLDEHLCATRWCNAATETLFGWPQDEVLERRAPMIPPEDEPAFLEAYRQARLGSAPQEIKSRCKRKDGLFRDVALWSQALPDSVATGDEVLLIVSDITAQVAREQDLLQAKRDLERIFARFPQAIVVIDPDSHAIKRCSPAVEPILGYAHETLSGQTSQQFYRDDTDYLEFCLWSKTALAAKHSFKRTCTVVRGDGKELSVVQMVAPLDASEESNLLMVIMEELNETSAKPDAARSPLDSSAPDMHRLGAMMYRTVNGLDWVLAFASEGARAVTGYAPGTFTQPGYPFYKEIIYEPDREHVLSHIRDAIDGAGQFDVRYQIKSAAGDLRWVDHQGTVVRPTDGGGAWVEGMIVDITRDMRTRDSLVIHRQEMQALLFHTLQGMEHVREGVAERIQRSIAGHVLASSSSLHGVATKIRKKAFVNDLQEIQKTLETTIEDCNAMAAEMTPPVLDRMGLNAALEFLLRDFRNRHSLYASLKWFGPIDRLDRDLEKFLYRATEELVHNVLKHAGVTEARVSVRVQSDLIRVAVKDFGRGFPNPDTPPKAAGRRGYGLFLIRECAAHLGGSCIVATKRGTGSRVTIEIPLPLATQGPPVHDENSDSTLNGDAIELHEL